MKRRNFIRNILLFTIAFVFGYSVKKEGDNLILQPADSTMYKVKDEKSILDTSEGIVSVTDFNIGTENEDVTVKLQEAIDYATTNNLVLRFPPRVYLVSPEKYRDTLSFGWSCLRANDNTKFHFEKGTILQLVDDAPAWSRVFVIENVSNVRVTGHLEIDGRCSTITNGNEHMSGVFIYNSKNIEIESLYSHDCYGDNLFVGGTEIEYSENVKVNYFNGTKAGRKNLVIHYVDKLHMGTVLLDNSEGGSDGDFSGERSLDLEPDNFLGTRTFYQRIDYLSTYGKGNDFTVGKDKEQAKKWILEIGTFNVRVMKGSTIPPLLSYAITVRIDNLKLTSTSEAGVGISLQHAAIWEINDALIENGVGYAIDARATSGGRRPILNIRNLTIKNTEQGISLWGANATFGNVNAKDIADRVLYIFSTADHDVSINNLFTSDCGLYVINISSISTHKPFININNINISDKRPTKATSILLVETPAASNGLRVGNIYNPDGVTELSFGVGNAAKFIRIGGGSTAIFMCNGSPERMISSSIGSIALRRDGGAGTSYYVKENGTGNTGWVPK
ncbi:hypothetical protein FC682_24010 [Peribacillus simplex]|uniref:hypothetical protein n=1 Tax=Peribacillus simplex TaxID=1478 RepID=UPI0010BE9ED5|nr:hypothetical protein [Peribacillus simplex]TKH00648.1 hypothetical protein FC682_24010 [Peribacillus simplex]